MDEVAKTRFKVLVGLAAVVAAVHVVLIIIFVSNGHKSAPEKETKEPQAAQKDQKNSAKKAPAVPAKRYFVPSKNPRFGQKFDFSAALRGNLPEQLVPGSKLARSGIIVDMDTRKVLWEKNSATPVPIASMAKMMTMLLVMEEMEKRPDIGINTLVPVTTTARNVPRTGVLYLAPGESFTIQELMIATAVKSANDAATLLAEYMGGTVPAFVARMNKKAALLDLKSLSFINPCGLPEGNRNSLGSAADMVLLGEQLLQYPLAMQWCNIKSSSIRDGKTVFVNTNKLVNPRYPGVDGLKTGYIRAAGSCLTFSALRDGRRIMGCVTGFKTSRDRDRFCRRLIDWAYKRPAKVPVKKAATAKR